MMKRQDKIRFYMNEKIKVHITMYPTSRFPRGKFQNGYILEICEKNDLSFIRFKDDVEGEIRLFPDEFDNIEECKERDGN